MTNEPHTLVLNGTSYQLSTPVWDHLLRMALEVDALRERLAEYDPSYASPVLVGGHA